MKSNQKQVIFFSMVIFYCQAIDSKIKTDNKHKESSEQIISLKETDLSLPKFFGSSQEQITKRPEYAFGNPKEYATKIDRQQEEMRYSKMTRLKDVKSMNKEKRLEIYNLTLELGYYSDSLFYHKHLLPLVEDKNELQKLSRHKADIYLALGNYKKASEEYLSYIEKYPGSKDYESSLFGYIFTLNEQKGDYDQDQEVTRTIIRYSEKYFLESSYKKYSHFVDTIYKDCYAMLYENEKSILKFYLKQKKSVAAEGRYAYLKKNYYEQFPQHRIEILALGCDVAQLQGNDQLFKERIAFLNKEFPSYNLAYGEKKHANRSLQNIF